VGDNGDVTDALVHGREAGCFDGKSKNVRSAIGECKAEGGVSPIVSAAEADFDKNGL